MTETVYDPKELVHDLVDKIGIETAFAIIKDIYDKTPAPDELYENDTNEDLLLKQINELRAHISYLESDKAMMQGEINGLRFAIRCNGVSGGEVR